ncbi:MAG: response regulator transcription factor [Saprospiraceae bacterium]
MANLKNNTDILLLDINLPIMSGIEAIPIIKNKNSKLKIIILTVSEDDNLITDAIIAGADGYILKKLRLKIF